MYPMDLPVGLHIGAQNCANEYIAEPIISLMIRAQVAVGGLVNKQRDVRYYITD